MTIDPKQTYTTRSGLPVRIYVVDGGGHYPVYGAVKYDDGYWSSECWSADGRHRPGAGLESTMDLLPAPREWKRWVVIERGIGPVALFTDKGDASREAARVDGTYFEHTIREPREDA